MELTRKSKGGDERVKTIRELMTARWGGGCDVYEKQKTDR